MGAWLRKLAIRYFPDAHSASADRVFLNLIVV